MEDRINVNVIADLTLYFKTILVVSNISSIHSKQVLQYSVNYAFKTSVSTERLFPHMNIGAPQHEARLTRKFET